jgi:hypothetical protein
MHGDARRLLDLCHAAAREVEASAVASKRRNKDGDDNSDAVSVRAAVVICEAEHTQAESAHVVRCSDVLAAIERMFGR